MRCPSCQVEVPATSGFCGECGTSLPAACPACGQPSTPGQKFCGECGAALGLRPGAARQSLRRDAPPESYTPKHLAEKILSSREAFEGERKQVTVMFADVSGFTAMSTQLDPEDVHGIMDRAFEVILDAVHRL